MSPRNVQVRFPSLNDWPMIARQKLLAEALRFLEPTNRKAKSRLLNIRGQSGIGKSFLVDSLLCKFAAKCPEAIILYADIDESEFESTDLEKRLIAVASHPTTSERTDPSNIPRDRCFARYIKSRPFPQRAGQVAFRLLRAAIGLIPGVGDPLKSVLPEDYPKSRIRLLAESGRLWEFLTAEASEAPVIVALDNIQFLPKSIQIEIDTRLASSETGFRFITIERVADSDVSVWQFRCFRENRHRIEIGPLSKESTDRLVTRILGKQVTNLPEVCAAIYRKSLGNPKQVWLQLRSIIRGVPSFACQTEASTYEEVILGLPDFDKLILQLVTLLIGGLRIEDLVSILHFMTQATPKNDIHQTVFDLVTMGFLIINGSASNYVKTEHELVRTTIRSTTSESELLGLRQSAILALTQHLDTVAPDAEKERLADRLIGLLSATEIRANKKHLVRITTLVERQSARGRYHYLAALFLESPISDIVDLLPEACLVSFLDAFQKTSLFDNGLVAIELIKNRRSAHLRQLSLYAAKYLVQKFQYREAERILDEIDPDPESQAIRFNILLNRCRDDEAREMVNALPRSPNPLDEFQCVMLRNSAHLYPADEARTLLDRAQHEFIRLGLTFGIATTRNNRGVLELWAGDLDTAYAELHAARVVFQELGSNEIYQPLNNLAILHAVRRNPGEARSLIQMAKDIVSPNLEMDALMLRHNNLCLRVLQQEVTLGELASESKLIYRESLKTRDARFQGVLALFAAEIDTLMSGTTEIPVSLELMRQLQSRETTGIELRTDAIVHSRSLSVIFVLSPHWRY
jgi:hypothetical protein